MGSSWSSSQRAVFLPQVSGFNPGGSEFFSPPVFKKVTQLIKNIYIYTTNIYFFSVSTFLLLVAELISEIQARNELNCLLAQCNAGRLSWLDWERSMREQGREMGRDRFKV